MKIYDFIERNPNQRRHVTFLELDAFSEDLYFKFGIKLPPVMKTFYNVQDGILLDEFTITSAKNIERLTENNIFINSVGSDKSICFGTYQTGCFIYNSRTKEIDIVDYKSGLDRSFLDVFGLFNYLYEYYELVDSFEEKTQADIYSENISFIGEPSPFFGNFEDIVISEPNIVEE